MTANTHCCNIGRYLCVQKRLALLDDGTDEFLHKMRMGTAMPGTLDERNIVFVEDYFAFCKGFQLVDQQFIRIGREEAAVSYTHLDVYKRQAEIRGKDIGYRFANAPTAKEAAQASAEGSSETSKSAESAE